MNILQKQNSASPSSNSGLDAIARGGFINLIGLCFSLVSGFLCQFILVKTLTPADVGLFNLSFTISGLIGLVVLFGLDRSIVRYVAYYWGKGDRPREIGGILSSVNILLVLISVTIPLFWFGADDLALHLFHKPALTPVLKVFILGVPFVTLTRLLMGVLQGYKRMKPLVLIEQISVPALRIVGMMVVIAFTQTSKHVAYSFLIASVIGCVLGVIFTGRFFWARKGDEQPILLHSALLQYSWPLFGASLLNRTNTHTETLVLGILSSSEQVGFFTVSFKIAVTLTVIFQSINAIMAPFIAEIYSRGNIDRLAYQLKSVTRWIFTLTLPVALVIFLEAPDIMAVLKPEYIVGTPVLQMLTLSHLASVMMGPVAILLTMTRYARLNLLDLFLTLILSLILDFLLIPRYGAFGAAIAGTVSITFVNVLRLVQVYRNLGIHPYSWSTFKPILGGGIAFIVFLASSRLLGDISALWRLIALSFSVFLTYGVAIVTLCQEEIDSEIVSFLLSDLMGRTIGNANSQ